MRSFLSLKTDQHSTFVAIVLYVKWCHTVLCYKTQQYQSHPLTHISQNLPSKLLTCYMHNIQSCLYWIQHSNETNRTTIRLWFHKKHLTVYLWGVEVFHALDGRLTKTSLKKVDYVYCKWHNNDKGEAKIRLWTQTRHPIAHPWQFACILEKVSAM